MKRLLLPTTVSIMLIMSTTACKTTEKAEMTNHNNTQVTQVEIKDLHPIDKNLLHGKWIITSAMGQPLVSDETAYIIIDTDTHRIYGNNGCNTFNGTLVLGENCTLSFTDCITTLMACRPEVTDGNVMQALGRTTYYNTTQHNHNILTIDLLDSTGSTVASLRRDMREMLNGQWNIVEADGMKIKLDEMPQIVIDIEENKFTGNSGCNIMNGSIESSDQENKIAFVGVVSTRRMCTPQVMEVEDKILDVINKVESFSILDNNRVALYNHASQYAIMILEKR